MCNLLTTGNKRETRSYVFIFFIKYIRILFSLSIDSNKGVIYLVQCTCDRNYIPIEQLLLMNRLANIFHTLIIA